MSDPTVTAFLTKVLCKHGGRLPSDLLSGFCELSTEQIKQILQEEPQKFPQVGELVLARSSMKICTKYLKNEEEEEECDKLHLCRHYLQGKCWPGRRPRCPFSHDIFSDQNQKVLKANEISGLNEDEIKVLLLQNDNQLLPEVCWEYFKESCDLGKDCSRLHICGYFTRGECNRRACKHSHHLLEFGSDLLLTRCGMSLESIQNFQMICTVKHNERLQTLKAENRKDQEKGQNGAQRGRGGRPRNREMRNPQDGTRSQSQGAAGFYGYEKSDSRSLSKNRESHLCGDDECRIKNDWFISKTAKSEDRGASLLEMAAKYSSYMQPMMSSGTHPPTPPMYTSHPVTAPKVSSAQSGNPAGHFLSSSTSSAPQPTPTITPLTTIGSVNASPTAVARPSKPVHLPVKGPLVADSVKAVPSTVVNLLASPVPTTASSTLTDSPTKSPSVPQEKPVNPPFAYSYRPQPVVITIKPASSPAASTSSAPSTPGPRMADSSKIQSPFSSRLVNSSTEGPSVQGVKPVQSNVQSQDPPAPSSGHQAERTSVTGAVYLPPKRPDPDKIPEICLSSLWKYCRLGGCCPDMHYYLPYRWQIYKGTDWEDIPNMEEIEKCYCDPKVDRVQSIDFVTMRSGMHRVRRLSTVSSVKKPQEYVLTTEWLWYWKDEHGTWTQYGQFNVKQVSSTILSSDLESIYLSDPTAVIPFTAGYQHYEINFREMKQRNIRYTTEKDVRRRPKYLSFENVKLLKGSTKSSAPQSPLQSPLSPLKTDIYPSTWDTSALPEIGCQKVPVSDTSSEFSEIVSSFTKTVSGHVVKKLWRLQNPSLWQVFQWQKEQMKNVNQGQDVRETRLFHGADTAHIDDICNQNFDWHLCGTNGTAYGQGRKQHVQGRSDWRDICFDP
ncbi:zinc finger CCCH-type antiviral protein 1-like isoform X1 [Hyla sarda]|uniref:zinc finger CCCH-type antiviral protein 1-like isoform X1 n=1 Tax=Hyla sarda TaxID=327740 RepID=UPI0024C2B585|nr:zinc finger CCCH-type antiviral protein 1-like isoform X1 [Hyla sarda]